MPKSPIRKMEGDEPIVDSKESRKDTPAKNPPKSDGLVGVPTERSELAPGARVKAFLAPGKPGSGAVTKKKVASGAIVDVAPANRPQIRMVVILEPAPVVIRKK